MFLNLTDKELKKEAKKLSIAQLNSVIATLTEVTNERENEATFLKEIEELAQSRGFSLRKLGLVQGVTDQVSDVAEKKTKEARPTKPKLKSVNAEKQFFYVEDGELKMLMTHTMKKGLLERGIELTPFDKLSDEHKETADSLIAQATKMLTSNYNEKVDIWNAYAQEHGLEILTKRV